MLLDIRQKDATTQDRSLCRDVGQVYAQTLFFPFFYTWRNSHEHPAAFLESIKIVSDLAIKTPRWATQHLSEVLRDRIRPNPLNFHPSSLIPLNVSS